MTKKLKQIIKDFCPNGVEYKPLGEICEILDNKRKPITKSARTKGKYPYYGANGIQDYVSDYIFDGVFVLVGEDGSVVTPKGNPVVNWAEGKIWVNNHAHIVEEKDGVLLRFLFHYIQTVNVAALIHGNIPKLTGGDFRAIKVPVPPLEVQYEIVRVLDNFTSLSAELSAELSARRKQYVFFRDKLLLSAKDNIEYSVQELIDLGMIEEPMDGNHGDIHPQKADYVDSGVPFIMANNLVNGTVDYDHCAYITEQQAHTLRKGFSKPGDVLLTHKGTIGRTAIVPKTYSTIILTPQVTYYRVKTGIDNHYLKYCFDSTPFQEQMIAMAGLGGTRAYIGITAQHLLKLKLPSLTEQKRISAILDLFDNLCKDLSSGLPAEIEARQKQYEYYRDKLLTFREKGTF